MSTYNKWITLLSEKVKDFSETGFNKDYKFLLVNNVGDVIEDEIGITDQEFLDKTSGTFYDGFLKNYQIFPEDDDVIHFHFHFLKEYEMDEYDLSTIKYGMFKTFLEKNDFSYTYNHEYRVLEDMSKRFFNSIGPDLVIDSVECLYDRPSVFVIVELKRMNDD